MDKREIADGHVDLPYFLRQKGHKASFRDVKDCPIIYDLALEIGVSTLVIAIYCEDRFNGPLSLSHFYHNLEFAKSLKEGLFDDVNSEPDPGKFINLIFSIENGDFLADLPRLEILLREGIRIIGLTHGGENRLAQGNNTHLPEGITKKGKEILKEMEDHGFVLDLAHLHERCLYQALDRFPGPVMVSHTGIREIFNIPRNITLNQAKEIISRRGLVCIGFNPEFLGEAPHFRIQDVYAHIDTLVQALGPDGIGIGSDVCGFEAPGFDYKEAFLGLEELLLNKGYGNATYDIIGGNLLGFLKSVGL